MSRKVANYIEFCSDKSKSNDKFTFIQGNEDTSPPSMFIMDALLLKSSLSVQHEVMQMIKLILHNKTQKDNMAEILLSYLD